jgi:hypothetical protein
MARTAQPGDVPHPRVRSREEIEETYRQVIVRDPEEGPALVATHRRIIILLDEMIEKRGGGVRSR